MGADRIVFLLFDRKRNKNCFSYELGLFVLSENCLSAKQPRKSGSDRIGVKRARLQALSRWERAFLRRRSASAAGLCSRIYAAA